MMRWLHAATCAGLFVVPTLQLSLQTAVKGDGILQSTPAKTMTNSTCADDDGAAQLIASSLGSTVSGCGDMAFLCTDPTYGATIKGACCATCCADDNAAAQAIATALGVTVSGCGDMAAYCADPSVAGACCATCNPHLFDLVYESPLDSIVDESSLESWMAGQQLRYFLSDIGRPGSRGTPDVHIAYVTIAGGSGDKGALVVVGGYGSNILLYDESLKIFFNKGYSPIYMLSHRGMGQSDRLIADHLKIHVESYDDYVQDLRKFVSIVRGEVGDGVPLGLYCVSMGCAMSFTYLSEESAQSRPQPFYAVVAQGPMVKAVYPGFTFQGASDFVNGLVAMGLGEEYTPGQTTSAADLFADHACNGAYPSVTRCVRNARRCNAGLNSTFGADGHVGFCSGAATNLMLKSTVDFYTAVFEPLIASGTKVIQPPVLMQLSGDPNTDDGTVNNTASSAFCQTNCQDCEITSLPTAAHFLPFDNDADFLPFMDATDVFFQAHKSTVVHGTGDPHMQNIHGERFDLMVAGKHTLIHIPRGSREGETLLHVAAEAQRLGGLCAEMYFTKLNITGAWADAEQKDGYAFRADGPGGKAESKWLSLGGVQMKVVRGHTREGIQYLNFYVKHLARVGFIVGGLLGEDVHDEVSTPSDACAHRMALVQF